MLSVSAFLRPHGSKYAYMEGVTDGDKEDEAEFADEPDVRDENDDMLAGEDLEEAMELMSMGSNPSKK